ncbi:hypothetical protein MLD52_23505, partial [Puniceicoccaceae bacterium K14]|nr:hypothetical protein [Puniceicoccaceae bacterium K14]MCH6259543.1 hypothetical protein [Puniceicoccaceae bacterium K14]
VSGYNGSSYDLESGATAISSYEVRKYENQSLLGIDVHKSVGNKMWATRLLDYPVDVEELQDGNILVTTQIDLFDWVEYNPTTHPNFVADQTTAIRRVTTSREY